MLKTTKTITYSLLIASCISMPAPTQVFAVTNENDASITNSYENSITETDPDFYLKLYQALENKDNTVYPHSYESYDLSAVDRASIDNETFNDYFSSCQWINRNGVISLSIQPTSKLLSSGNVNGNVLAARASRAFTLLKNKYSSSSYWKNTASMEAQFHCHVLAAGGMKTPWNIEPHRTESNWAKVFAAKCNP